MDDRAAAEADGRREAAPGPAGARRAALLDSISLLAPRRSERRRCAAFVAAVGALALLPASILFPISVSAWDGIDPSIGTAVDAAKVTVWAGVTALALREYVHGNRLLRLRDILDRARALRESMKDRTLVERLAILQEMQNCYAETDRYLARVGDEEIVVGVRRVRMYIESMYCTIAGEVGQSKEGAAEFARAMEGLGRSRDGGRAPLDGR